MARAKQASKRKRGRIALPVLGAAGASLAMTGGASASAVPTADLPWKAPVNPVITMDEEEISDVSLATFYVFDRDSAIPTSLGMKIAQRCGRCGGGGGCRGCGGAGRCGGGGCAAARCAAARCAAARCAAARCAAGGCRGCACAGRCARCARCGVWTCAGCSCSCTGCAAPCWAWGGAWIYIC